MPKPSKDAQARAIIDEFAQALWTLNGSRSIPSEWEKRVQAALRKRPRRKRGRPQDKARDVEIMVRWLLAAAPLNPPLSGELAGTPDEEPPPPGTQARIAHDLGISQPTVSRAVARVREDAALLREAQAEACARLLRDELRK